MKNPLEKVDFFVVIIENKKGELPRLERFVH
jgi:hypothetical protein